MNFSEAIKVCFRKYAEFSGRAGRPEFWWFVLFEMVVLALATRPLGEFVGSIATAALFVPGIAVGARRLHDVGKSGWFQLLYLSGIGTLLLLYWFVQPSDGPNQFGNPEVTPYSPTVMPGPSSQQ